MSICGQAEKLRDYAFEELAGGERFAMEKHIGGCAECAGELDRLRVTTAALRTLPDREMPRRIAFVSDGGGATSPWLRWFGARWGFASACVLALGLSAFAYRRPVEIRTVVQTAAPAAAPDMRSQVNEAVAKAVSQVRAEDAQAQKALLETLERDRRRDQQSLMEAVTVMQNRVNTSTLLASLDNRQAGAGQ